MIHALPRQILASLRQSKLQTFFVFVTLIGAAMALSVALILWTSAADPWERRFERSNAPHVVVYGDGPNVDFSPVINLPGITGVSDPIPTIWTRSLGASGSRVEMLGVAADGSAIAIPEIARGRWLEPADTQAIVVEYAYARENALAVGDSIEIPINEGSERFTIVGLSITLWRGPYPDTQPPVVYVLPESLERLRGDETAMPILMVRLHDPESARIFAESAKAQMPGDATCCTSTWLDVRETITGINDINIGFLTIFAGLAMLAAGFVIANTIAGRVIEHGRNIALLKAIGQTPGQITLSMLLEHLVLAIPAGLIGYLAGAWATRFFLWRAASPYGESPAATGYWDWFGPFLLLYLGIVALFSIVPAWRGGHLRTTQALRPARSNISTRPSAIAQFAVRLRLPLVSRLGLKDLFARPTRSLLMASSIALVVSLITIAMGAEMTLADYRSGAIWADNPPELELHRGFVGHDETTRIINETEGIESHYEELFVDARLNERPDSVSLRAVQGDFAGLGLRIVEGRQFSAPGEMIVGQGLLDANGLEIGDAVTARIDGQSFDFQIVGRYVEFDQDGQIGLFDFTTIAEAFPNREPGTYHLQVAPGVDPGDVRARLTAASNGAFMVDQVEPDASQRDVYEIRVAIYSIVAIVLVIGVINIVTTSMLDLRERQREIGVLKSLGMTIREITAGALTRTITIAFVGALIGIPLGMIIGYRIYDHYAAEDGLGTGLARQISISQMALLIPAALIFAALSALVPIVLSLRTPPAEALRYE